MVHESAIANGLNTVVVTIEIVGVAIHVAHTVLTLLETVIVVVAVVIVVEAVVMVTNVHSDVMWLVVISVMMNVNSCSVIAVVRSTRTVVSRPVRSSARATTNSSSFRVSPTPVIVSTSQLCCLLGCV